MRETESSRNLYEIAEPQFGFFTAKQAKKAGYDESKHAYHVRAGNWIREYRGIYRLRSFPTPERPDLMLWSLWSRNRDDVPQGSIATTLRWRSTTFPISIPRSST